MTPEIIHCFKSISIQLTAQAIKAEAARRTAADMAIWEAFSSASAGPLWVGAYSSGSLSSSSSSPSTGGQ